MASSWLRQIEGWTITEGCEPYKPDGWRSGNSIQQAVYAVAELDSARRDHINAS